MATVTTSTRRAAAKVAAPAASLKVSAKAERRATITDAMRNSANALPVAIKGKARIEAAHKLATGTYREATTRGEIVANVRATFGLKPGQALTGTPDAALLDYTRRELTLGRAAARLPADVFPSNAVASDMAARIAFVRDCHCFYSAPAEEGKATRALPKGKVGPMDIRVYKALRNSAANTTEILGDAGVTGAKGRTEKNAEAADKVKAAMARAPHHKAPTVVGKDDAPAKVEYTAASFTAFMAVQLRSLEQQCNKQAKVCPTAVAAAIKAAIALVDKESKLQDKLVADRVSK